jgi:hypothetical protein
MDATKLFLILFYLSSAFIFGQESKYPKDTIYIYFDNNKYIKKELNHPKLGKSISFGKMGVYYNFKKKSDTLCFKHLKDYHFLNLKEIEKKEKQYYKKRFDGNPWIKNKNWVFHTFLIDSISKEKFVVYPVIWRSQGIAE